MTPIPDDLTRGKIYVVDKKKGGKVRPLSDPEFRLICYFRTHKIGFEFQTDWVLSQLNWGLEKWYKARRVLEDNEFLKLEITKAEAGGGNNGMRLVWVSDVGNYGDGNAVIDDEKAAPTAEAEKGRDEQASCIPKSRKPHSGSHGPTYRKHTSRGADLNAGSRVPETSKTKVVEIEVGKRPPDRSVAASQLEGTRSTVAESECAFPQQSVPQSDASAAGTLRGRELQPDCPLSAREAGREQCATPVEFGATAMTEVELRAQLGSKIVREPIEDYPPLDPP